MAPLTHISADASDFRESRPQPFRGPPAHVCVLMCVRVRPAAGGGARLNGVRRGHRRPETPGDAGRCSETLGDAARYAEML